MHCCVAPRFCCAERGYDTRQGVGIDAPQPSDLYYRLLVDKVFYVGGMGGTAAAETLSREVGIHLRSDLCEDTALWFHATSSINRALEYSVSELTHHRASACCHFPLDAQMPLLIEVASRRMCTICRTH